MLDRWIGPLKILGVEGLSSPFTYLGGFGNVFCLHTEDKNLLSASVNLAGHPKFWFGCPGQSFPAVVAELQNIFPADYERCPVAHRHKRYFLRPEVLRQKGIPVFEAVHDPGSIIITFPKAFHQGFNGGTLLRSPDQPGDI